MTWDANWELLPVEEKLKKLYERLKSLEEKEPAVC